MPRSARIACALLLAPQLAVASPLPSPPGLAPAAVRLVSSLVNAAGANHCRITGFRLLRDGYETLIDNDFMARRTPGARVAITIS
jgi:hypothetical protein